MTRAEPAGSSERYPVALVGDLREVEPGVRLVARRVLADDDRAFAGHFPGRPLLPGVLICEALAQAGTVLIGAVPRALPPSAVVHLRRLERARFRRPVRPGDVLELEVRVLERRDASWRLRGRARVGEAVVADAEFTMMVRSTRAGGATIHPTAIVAESAVLAPDVTIGPYAVVGPRVTIGAGTTVGSHVVIEGRTTIGAGNRIFQFASVGAEPQDLKYRGEESTLHIGDRNIIREFATLNPGTEGGGMVTALGDDNLLMNCAHVGHDSRIGNACVLANSCALAGHVTLEDHVIVGGLAAVHQFVRIGESAFLGGGAMVERDVPPFCNAAGDRARLRGLNLVGLRRRGFSAERVRTIKRAYQLLFAAGTPLGEAQARCRAELGEEPDVARLLAFLAGSARGVSPAARRDDGDDDPS